MNDARRGALDSAARTGLIARYRDWLPVSDATPELTLFEGSTPLLPAPRLAEWIGVEDLWLKFEGANPTGSFKDRGMVIAVAKAMESGARAVLCASTGNTAASAAAYAARAGLASLVVLPRGQVAAGKVAQAVRAGARVVVIEDNFDRALDIAREASADGSITLVNSVNSHRIEGQATVSYEICDELGDAPGVIALPVGNGGNITACWLGFRRYRERGRSARLPRVLGVQAAGAAPLVLGRPVASPETVATAIRIGRPATWDPALAAVRDSAGVMLAVTDSEILEAWATIPRLEGVFCEPASAASVAGLRRAVLDAVMETGERCVCILTGHGLKDPETALAGIETGPTIPAGEALDALRDLVTHTE
ncbi:MAG: threonine synthase [Gemmatimonadetes bacterium]|nr:threonine synthase [Gemmatimonadota bacterium]